jgi:flagella synthesis protein FlgN
MTDIAATLTEEVRVLDSFVELLNREQTALVGGKPEQLPPLAEAKTGLIDKLNRLETTRSELVGGRDKSDMERWLGDHTSQQNVYTLWEQIKNLSREARRLNTLNAQLLALHLRRTSEALDILTRHHRNNLTYGSDGQTGTLTGSRIVDSA